MFHFRQAEEQGLPSSFRRAALAVHADVEGVFDRLQDFLAEVARVFQGAITFRSTRFRERRAEVLPAMLPSENSSWATRQ